MRLLLILLFLVTPLTRAEETPTFLPEAQDRIDHAITSAIERGKLPGAVLWLEHHDQIFKKAYGNRALEPVAEPMTLDTIFDAASLTKVLATTPSIMKLIEDGRLHLDDKASLHLPTLTGDPNKARITIRHLLTHTSGLPAGIRRGYEWNGQQNGIALACAEPSAGRAGLDYLYSDINFLLLGEIVHRLSGQPLDQFAATHLFQPLGMKDTSFRPGHELLPRIAPTTRLADRTVLRGTVHDPTARPMDGVAGHAGLFTTAHDLARFARMLLHHGTLHGVRIFKPETVTLMTSVQTTPNISARRGLGWDIDSPYAGPRGKHFPLGSFGHTGWTGTSLWIDPYSQTFLILLSNRNHPTEAGNVRPLRHQLGTLAAEAIPDFDFTNVPDALLPLNRADQLDAARKLTPRRPKVRNGIDTLVAQNFAELKDLKIGLITNQTGRDRTGRSTIDLLHNAPDCQLTALFAPEHGLRGTGEGDLKGGVDEKTKLPVHSLYAGINQRKPRQEDLADLDALVFDMQDIGCRFFTYISTMALAMDAAAEAGIKFIVLDRVNPIGGIAVDGPLLVGEGHFTGIHQIPLRHGMTVGELANLFREERCPTLDLTVVPLEGWQRSMLFDQTGLPWTKPSPNMPALTPAVLYPGVGMLEFTNLSVGRGTPLPFELVGAPYIDPEPFAAQLNAAQLPGLQFIPVHFTPTTSKFANEPCGGVRILLKNRTAPTTQIGLHLARALRKLHPDHWDSTRLNFLLRHPPTTNALLKQLPLTDILPLWQSDLQSFAPRRQKHLLYR